MTIDNANDVANETVLYAVNVKKQLEGLGKIDD